MKRKVMKIRLLTIILLLTICWTFLFSQESQRPPHIAYNIHAERIKYTNDSIKITWSMNRSYDGDFVVGRLETAFSSSDDVLKSKLVGIFNPSLEGVLIDRGLNPGKKYYYTVVAKKNLLNRKIEILRGVNTTSEPVSLYVEPGMTDSIEAQTKDKSVRVRWGRAKGDNIKYNLYRSRSVINSRSELGVADKLTVTKDRDFSDRNVPEYGSYYYAVTVVDKNGIEYFNPLPGKNFTTSGIYLKGKTLSSPLNVGAYLGEGKSVIIKWVKSNSRTEKVLAGYEIYRSEEMINSTFKLKFARLIKIADQHTVIYTDVNPGPGKFYYAVFPRYSDGSSDIGFDLDSNYTKTPVVISIPYKIKKIDASYRNKTVTINWDYTGNSGTEKLRLFKSSSRKPGSREIEKNIIGTESIKSKSFTVKNPESGIFYYGIIEGKSIEGRELAAGVNITRSPLTIKDSIINQKKDEKGKSVPEISAVDGGLNSIIKRTFYRGRYRLAVKELINFIRQSDNESSKAEALLFIGKSYIELEEYERGIRYLSIPDVKKNFSHEALFWRDFALKRLK